MTTKAEVGALFAEVVLDAPSFCGLLEIPTKAGGLVPFGYDAWNAEQRAFFDTRTLRDLVLKARQIGMTTLLLALALHFVLTHEGVTALVVSHDEVEVERMFEQVRAWVTRLVSLGLIPKPKFSTKREQTWAFNRSTIRIAAAGATDESASKKGRSGTIHWLHMTEVAFWGAAAETMTALMAAAENGYIVAESTANGAAGTFYDLCTTSAGGAGEWSLKFFPWYEHAEYRRAVPFGFDPAPRDADEVVLRERGCDDEQIAWWRARVDDPSRGGVAKVKQEYPIDPASCFVMPGGAFLDAATCDWLASVAREPIGLVPMVVSSAIGGATVPKRLGDLAVYAEPTAGAQYVIGADVSEGVEGDESALDVMERRTGATVATFASNTISPGDFGLALAFAARRYNMALVAPERNNHGHTTLRTLAAERTSVTPYPRVYAAGDGRPGWLTSPATRPPLFDELAGALRDRSTSSPCRSFAQQSRTLVRGQSGKPAASGKGTKGGARDDRWVARAIAWQLRQRDTGPRAPLRESERSDSDQLGDLA